VTHPGSEQRTRTMGEAIVRVQLLLVLPAALLLIGVAVTYGGGWLLLLPPACLLLLGHAKLVARFRFRTWYGAFGNVGLLVALTAIATLVVGPMLGLYRTVTVLSGSMRPTFSPGDMIVVSPEPMSSLRVGDVITFMTPTAGHPVETHRVVSIAGPLDEPIVQTRGDANNTIDPWHAQLQGGTVWRYRLRLPAFAYPLLALRSRWVHLGTTLLLPFLLSLWGLGRLWLPSRRNALTNA
jgi:signal peptidase I